MPVSTGLDSNTIYGKVCRRSRNLPSAAGAKLWRAAACCILGTSALLSAQSPAAAQPDSPLSRSPREWVVQACANEIGLLNRSDVYLRYRTHVIDRHGDRVRDVIESREGTVARTIMLEGKPLTADEDQAERARLQAILDSPSDFARHMKSDASGKKLAADLIRLMPDAMINTYTPGQPQTGHSKGITEVVMDYHPNPKWSPPTTTSEALTGLEGRVWIDIKSGYVVRMEGHIFKPVNLGWGMLAHIYPGGDLVLEQANVENGRWAYTHFKEDIEVRALMVKTLKMQTQVDAFSFQVLPHPMSYQEAVRALLATPLPAH